MGAKISSCLNCPKSPQKSEIKKPPQNQNEPFTGYYNEQIQKNNLDKGQDNITNKNVNKKFNGNLEEKQDLNSKRGLFEEEKGEVNVKNSTQNNKQNENSEKINEEKIKEELEKKRIEEEKQKEEKKQLSLELKQKGNDFFLAKQYEKAIEQYTLAIVIECYF